MWKLNFERMQLCLKLILRAIQPHFAHIIGVWNGTFTSWESGILASLHPGILLLPIAVDNQRKRTADGGWLRQLPPKVAEKAARQLRPGLILASSCCPATVRFVYATIKIRNERDCKLKEIKEYVTSAGCIC